MMYPLKKFERISLSLSMFVEKHKFYMFDYEHYGNDNEGRILTKTKDVFIGDIDELPSDFKPGVYMERKRNIPIILNSKQECFSISAEHEIITHDCIEDGLSIDEIIEYFGFNEI